MPVAPKRILFFSTYPIVRPEHGGQKRATAIVEQYRSAGHEVKTVAVYHSGFYPLAGRDDIAVGATSIRQIERSIYSGDIICGEAITDDAEVAPRVEAVIAGFNPDVIHLEQVYPYFGLAGLLKRIGYNGKLVYGSQNLEGKMKEEILLSVGATPAVASRDAERITALERQLCQDADLVLAVTKDDQAAYEKMGAKNVILAKNGISQRQASQSAKEYWFNRFKELDVIRPVLFVGSAHPPNWEGFLRMVGDRMGFLPFGTKIIMAGGIANYFTQTIKTVTPAQTTFWQRVVPVGRLDDDELAALLELADVIILPITEGGGSNLKTAEAILANKKIVATTFALRSFEHFTSFPNLLLADKPEAFRAGILRMVEAPKAVLTPEELKQTKSVQWQFCLKEAAEAVASL